MKTPIIIILLVLSNCLFAQTKIDSLENLLLNDTKNVSLLNKLSNAYWHISPEKGIEYAKKAEIIALSSGNKTDLGKALQNIGVNQWAKSEYSNALENYKKALSIFKEIEDFKNYGAVLSSMGVVYRNLSDYDNALYYYLKALEIAEKDNSSLIIPTILNNISLVYMALKNYDKASEYIFQAIDLSKKQKHSHNLSAYLNNLGLIYEDQNDYIKAKNTYHEALLNNIKNNNNYGKTICLYNIGNAEYNLKNYNESMEYFHKSLILSNEIDDKFGVLLAHKSIGVLYKEMKKYNKALEHYSISLKLANELNSKEEKVEIYKVFSELYKEIGSFNKSLNYFEKYALYKDSIYSEESSRQIAEMQTKYETVKKEKENELLRKNGEIQKLDISKQTNLRNYFIGISILVILMIIILLNRFKIKKKANQLLILKNKVISNQRDELKETNLKLRKVNADKDKLMQIIAHDLRSPFNSIIGFSEILIENLHDFEIAKSEKFIKIINSSAKNTLTLLDNLLNWAKNQTGNINFTSEKLLLSNIIDKILKASASTAKLKNIYLNHINTGTIEVCADENMVQTILRNLVSNAIKFTKTGGSITVSATQKGKIIEITIADTGIGIPEETLKKLFDTSTNLTTNGTENEKGSGLGLILCKEFVEKNGGTIWAESNLGEGSKFIFTLPSCNNK